MQVRPEKRNSISLKVDAQRRFSTGEIEISKSRNGQVKRRSSHDKVSRPNVFKDTLPAPIFVFFFSSCHSCRPSYPSLLCPPFHYVKPSNADLQHCYVASIADSLLSRFDSFFAYLISGWISLLCRPDGSCFDPNNRQYFLRHSSSYSSTDRTLTLLVATWFITLFCSPAALASSFHQVASVISNPMSTP